MERLKDLEGFALDMRSPGVDQVALEYANDWFGPMRVANVLSVLHRSETSYESMKEDLLWGYPIDVMIEEGRYFYPYLKWMKEEAEGLPIAYQVEMATGGMEYINQMVQKHKHCKFICGDWSKFDKSIPFWLIRLAFDVIRRSFDFSKVRGKDGVVRSCTEKETELRFRRMVRYFIYTPVRMSTGERFRKTGGVPSGSMFTNIIDSIANMIVMRYCIYQTSGNFPSGEIYLGDDSVCAVSGIVNLTDIANLAMEKFGMKLNEKKSYVTTKAFNVHFLGYFNKYGRPHKAQDFLIASFVYPERVVKTNEVRVSRALGQMWSTMDCAAAYPWYRIVEHMLIDFGISRNQLHDYIQSHPGQFKYLRILGITAEMIRLPKLEVENLVREVDPKEDLLEYDREYASSDLLNDPVFQLAYESVLDQMTPKGPKLIPLSMSSVEVHPDLPKDRSPGLPWILKGYPKKRDCLDDPEAVRVWRTKWSRIAKGKPETLPDVALYFRAQIAKTDTNKLI
jgi:hypothetical protein